MTHRVTEGTEESNLKDLASGLTDSLFRILCVL